MVFQSEMASTEPVLAGLVALQSRLLKEGTATIEPDVFVHLLTGQPASPREQVINIYSETSELGVAVQPASWLPEALQELNEAFVEAEEEGYSRVPQLTRARGKQLLSELATRVTSPPIVHSTPEGGIAIDFRNPGQDAAVLLVCEPDGEGVCLYDIAGKRGRARFSDAGELLEVAGWFALGRMGLV